MSNKQYSIISKHLVIESKNLDNEEKPIQHSYFLNATYKHWNILNVVNCEVKINNKMVPTQIIAGLKSSGVPDLDRYISHTKACIQSAVKIRKMLFDGSLIPDKSSKRQGLFKKWKQEDFQFPVTRLFINPLDNNSEIELYDEKQHFGGKTIVYTVNRNMQLGECSLL